MNLIKKLFTTSPKNIALGLKRRLNKNLFKFKYKNLNRFHNWNEIQNKLKINKSFDTFFKELQKSNTFNLILKKLNETSDKNIIEEATKIENNFFNFFGEEKEIYNPINWQKDFNLKSSSQENVSNKFYQEIKIRTPQTQNFQDYSFDIKVPWELSRLQHLYYLGHAFETTKSETYSKIFYDHVQSWAKQNKFLYGTNWICPMEVAIRAINLILAFNQFKFSKKIPSTFWQQLICILYDHAIYLESNFEKYDKTNNHYLSDLIGYFYLCLFFEETEHFKAKLPWVYNEILDEFDKQIQPDGTSYEGSTNYHRLVTEILWHFQNLCFSKKRYLDKTILEKFKKMQDFISDCTNANKELIQIGDNDSGKIVSPKISFAKEDTNKQEIIHYSNFGISIIKSNVKVIFRHPTYNQIQPSGHFHQDDLAVIFDFNSQPILVDCGSYLYTANKTWRNFMRSFENHNTFFIKEKNKDLKLEELFSLEKEEQADNEAIFENKKTITIKNHSTQSNFKNIKKQRTLTFNKFDKTIKIEDYIQSSKKFPQNLEVYWNFIFHPDLSFEKINTNIWGITLFDKPILQMKTNIAFEKSIGFYSPHYGKIEPCQKLTTKLELQTNSSVTKVEKNNLFYQNCALQIIFEPIRN